MRKLQKGDREAVEAYFRRNRWETFYHYFPLLYAISESTQPLMIDAFLGKIFDITINEKEYYFEPSMWRPTKPYIEEGLEKVWIATRKCPIEPAKDWKDELYDVNYIYDLDYTLGIRNFRKNVKKFEKAHPDNYYGVEPLRDREGKAWEIVKKWYQISQRSEFTDFGYTEWLTKNLEVFEDLNPRVILVGDEAVAFSLWGTIRSGLGIHLICKDIGWPYLQDYTRYCTYLEMKEAGIELVNDGSDCGEAGIRAYKSKLRPKFIVPVYSWIREG